MLTIVLKQISEIIILKCFGIASFQLKSTKIFLTPFLQTPVPSAPCCAAYGGGVAFGNDSFNFAPPPPSKPKPETTSLGIQYNENENGLFFSNRLIKFRNRNIYIGMNINMPIIKQ